MKTFLSVLANAARAGVFACVALSGIAQAQQYPSKAVRLIVPYAPGGAPDVLARSLGIKLADSMGQPFVVDNKPGAGGIGAAEIAARSPADGHTVFFSDIQQLAINPHVFKKLPYDAERDFVPVSLAATIPLYVAVQSSAKINSLADLVAAAKAKPGSLTYGSSGIGSIHHIAMESMLAALGIQVTHIPYKGAGQSVPAFMGAETTLVIAAFPQLDQYVKSGKGKLIAVTTAKRSAQAPDVPAISETVPGYDFSSEMGIVVPAGTSPAIVAKLSQETAKALKDPATVTRLNGMGANIIGSTPEGYAANIRANLAKFKKAIEIAGIKAE
jgi:tripartite-type tricarboxylate transporter receptor subunit TctC